MATKRVVTLDIASASEKSIKAGQLDIPKGKQLKGLILYIKFPLKNASGGAITPSAVASLRQSILNTLRLSVSYGKGLERKPYIAVQGNRIRLEARDAYNSEIEGWADATNGFATACADGATSSRYVWLPIPLGRRPEGAPTEKHLFGMGRSQAKTLELIVKRETDATNTVNFTIDPAVDVLIEVYPDYESVHGDVWGLVPHYHEKDEVSDNAVLPEGLPLRIGERTSTHAATALTNFDVKVDEEEMYMGVGPKTLTRERQDDSLLTTGGDVSDEEVVLYKPRVGATLRWLQTGKPKFRQNVKDLATAKLNVLYVPYHDETTVKAEIQDVANRIREKTLRAGNAFLLAGLNLPRRIQQLPVFHLWDEQDAEFSMAPGFVATPGQATPTLTVPASFQALATAKAAAHEKAGETAAAARVADEVAALVPGASTSGRGNAAGMASRIGALLGLKR